MSPRTRRRVERGGALTIVAVLLGLGVLLGAAAVSVDVGRLLAEKGQLQNSADAASLSLASDCWLTPAGCTVTSNENALANGNALDSTASIQSACSVNIPGSPINGCPSSSGTLADCSPLPPALAAMSGLPYVEVRTRTKNAAGGSTLTNWLAGAGGTATSSAGACARAALGTPGDGVGELPLTLSACEWHRATGGTIGGGGGGYYASPDYTAYPPNGYTSSGPNAWPLPPIVPAPATYTPPTREVILMVQNPPGGQTPPSSCPNWQGHALPGGFGLLETVPGNDCKLKEYAYSWMHTSPGQSTECNLANFVGKVVSVPVFTCTFLTTDNAGPGRDPIFPPTPGADPCNVGTGNNAWYWRAGYAAFYLSGYSATTTGPGSPNKVSSINPNNTIPNGQNPCGNSETCISGWFLTDTLSASTITGPPSGGGFYGVVAAVPAG